MERKSPGLHAAMSKHEEGGASDESLLKVCRLLNEEGARYLVAGGFAVIMHRVPRFTQDIDLLIEEDEENYLRVIAALSRLEDGAARELTPQDLRENLVVKIADEVEVDVSRRAWVVTFLEALPQAKREVIEGIEIPFGLRDLIRSKQTHRDKDRLDIQMLLEAARERGEKTPDLVQMDAPRPRFWRWLQDFLARGSR